MEQRTVSLAVMFADIVGSTRLYSALGDEAARGVVAAFTDRCAAVVARHGGKLIKAIGDATLSSFPSADKAVLAASALQADMKATPAGGQMLRLHIGLHYGPVMEEEGDVFGTTVNIAAYLTDMAAPDQILTSEALVGPLTKALRNVVRSLFRARLKGGDSETRVFEVLWRADRGDLTELNPQTARVLPEDQGALQLTYRGQVLRVDHLRPVVRIGRDAESDIMIASRMVSREHAVIRADGPEFFLSDCSINGTLVEFDDGRRVHLLHREVALDGSGSFWAGRWPPEAKPEEAVRFARDRRSVYRV